MALVMYDLDGTLVDTVEEISIAVNTTLSQHGHPPITLSKIKLLIGHGTGWLMKQAWPDTFESDADEVWAMIMQDFMRNYSRVVGSKSKLYPQVLETLNALKERGVKQAVITNKEEPFTSYVLAQNGIKPFFDMVISGNTFSVKKPDAMMINHCIHKLGEHLTDCLFIGDSAIDIETARNAKVTCWAVPYGYNRGKDIRLSNPDKLIDNISAALDFFD